MKETRCPVCLKKEAFRKYAYKTYPIMECGFCALQYIWPFPKPINIKRMYEKNYFSGELAGVKGYYNYTGMEKELTEEAGKRLEYIEYFTQKKRLLDVGAGTGTFLTVAKQKGYLPAGNDISFFACNAMEKKGIKSYPGPIENSLPTGAFDVVTAWDVVEHIPNIRRAVKSIAKALKPGGYFFLTTPDTQSIDARILRGGWYSYHKIPEHVLFFNRRSLEYLLEAEQLTLIDYKPWGFIRSLGFLADRMVTYSSIFSPGKRLLDLFHLSKITYYFPLTDCMVTAQKKVSS